MRIGDKEYRIPDISFEDVVNLETFTGKTFNELVSEMQRGSMTAIAIIFSCAVNYDFKKATKLISDYFKEGGSLEELTKEINCAIDQSSFFNALRNQKSKKVPER